MKRVTYASPLFVLRRFLTEKQFQAGRTFNTVYVPAEYVEFIREQMELADFGYITVKAIPFE